jgi:hypothetical protein
MVHTVFGYASNKPGYELYIFDSAEATKRLENQSNPGCMAEVMQRLGEMLRQVNLFAVTQTNASDEICE